MIRKAHITAMFFVVALTSALFYAHRAEALISSNLSLGSRGAEVSRLQSYLALDRALYPEALVTGYYGRLTASAVARLQARYGFPQVGIVGPRTRALLATLMPPATPTAVALAIQDRTTASQQKAKAVCNTDLITNGYDRDRIISKDACDLLNYLYEKGLAAGNAGDTYDNRDNLHVNLCEDWTPNPDCPAEHKLFEQVTWKLSGGAGAARSVTPGVTVGQASYSGTPDKHSILYALYQTQDGAASLYRQYIHNNLYAYPALNDDALVGDPNDPKTLYDTGSIDRARMNIANAPYAAATRQIARAGAPDYRIHDASGSDLPYVKLALAGLAAFKPDIKEKLKAGVSQNGDQISLLMPTLQMLIRSAYKPHTGAPDYLNSPAHRSAVMMHYFANGMPQPAYDSLELVRSANSLDLRDVPPLVQLRVLSDSFDASERLFTTPGAIARRISTGRSRAITVSARDSISIDDSKGSYEYEWRLLAGDPSRAVIVPDPQDRSKAAITFASGTSTERIDIGVFVRRPGQRYYSVPGMITVDVR